MGGPDGKAFVDSRLKSTYQAHRSTYTAIKIAELCALNDISIYHTSE